MQILSHLLLEPHTVYQKKINTVTYVTMTKQVAIICSDVNPLCICTSTVLPEWK